MKLFKNSVGRPSNETLKKRRVIYVISAIAFVALVGVSIFFVKKQFFGEIGSKSKNAATACAQPYNLAACENEGYYGRAHGPAIQKLQEMLKEAGYHYGYVNGNYGSYTVDAVKRAQKAFGLQQTGQADYQLVEKLAPKYNYGYAIVTYNRNGGTGTILGTKNDKQFFMRTNTPISTAKLTKSGNTHVGWVATSTSRYGNATYYYGCSSKNCTKPTMYTAAQKNSLGSSFVPYVFTPGEKVHSDTLNALDGVKATFTAYWCSSTGATYNKSNSSCSKGKASSGSSSSSSNSNANSTATRVECYYNGSNTSNVTVPAYTKVSCSAVNLPSGVTSAKWYYNNNYRETTKRSGSGTSWSFNTPSESKATSVTVKAILSNNKSYSTVVKVAPKVTANPKLECYYNGKITTSVTVPAYTKVSCSAFNLPSGVTSVKWYYNNNYRETTKRNGNGSSWSFYTPSESRATSVVIKALLTNRNSYSTVVKVAAKPKDTTRPTISTVSVSNRGLRIKASDNVSIWKICVGTKNCKNVYKKSVDQWYDFSFSVGQRYYIYVYDTAGNYSSQGATYYDTVSPSVTHVSLLYNGLVISASDNVLVNRVCLGSTSNCKYINTKSVSRTVPFSSTEGTTYTVYVYDNSGNYTTRTVKRPDTTRPSIKMVTLTSLQLMVNASDNVLISRVCLNSSINCKYVNSKSIANTFYFAGSKPGQTYKVYVYDTSGNYSVASVRCR